MTETVTLTLITEKGLVATFEVHPSMIGPRFSIPTPRREAVVVSDDDVFNDPPEHACPYTRMEFHWAGKFRTGHLYLEMPL